MLSLTIIIEADGVKIQGTAAVMVNTLMPDWTKKTILQCFKELLQYNIKLGEHSHLKQMALSQDFIEIDPDDTDE